MGTGIPQPIPPPAPPGYFPVIGCPLYAVGCSAEVMWLAARAARPDIPPGQMVIVDTTGFSPVPFVTVYALGVPVYTLQIYRSREGVAAVTDDDLVNALHFNWTGAGAPDEPADFEPVENRVEGFFDDLAEWFHSSVRLYQGRWYLSSQPAPNPAIRTVTSWDVPGTSNTLLPPQVAQTLTLMTSVRRRWGRIYLGGLSSGAITPSTGRIFDGFMGALIAAANTAFEQTMANWELVVAGAGGSNPQIVNAVRCDDVADVIRSRRYGTAFERDQAQLVP